MTSWPTSMRMQPAENKLGEPKEVLKKRNKAKCHSTTAAGAPSHEAEEDQPEPTEPAEQQVERPAKTIHQLMEELDEARVRGKIPPAAPATAPAAALGVSLPGMGFHQVPMEDELLPDTNILNHTLPDEPTTNYIDLQPLMIDDTTLEANLVSEMMACLGSAPTVAACKEPQPPIAEKVPHLEIQQKYNEMLAERERLKEAETRRQAALQGDDEELSHLQAQAEKQKKRQDKATAAVPAKQIPSSTARASTSKRKSTPHKRLEPGPGTTTHTTSPSRSGKKR